MLKAQLKTRIIALAMAGGLALAALGGCTWSTHTDAPDPTGPHTADATNLRVLKMPDGFRNVAYGCDAYGNMVYVTSASASDTLPSSVYVVQGGCRQR